MNNFPSYDDEECCAHMSVKYRTKPSERFAGAVTGFWECEDCGELFTVLNDGLAAEAEAAS